MIDSNSCKTKKSIALLIKNNIVLNYMFGYNDVYNKNKRDYMNLKSYGKKYVQFGGDIKEDIKNGVYDKILGAGGFGVVYGSSSLDKAVKLIRDSKCADARKEFNIHKRCYDAFLDFPNKLSQIDIIEPLEFTNEEIKYKDNSYSCAYSMRIINNIKTINHVFDDSLYHVIYKDDDHYLHMFDKQVGLTQSLPISEKNPSRGFFATGGYIENNILQNFSAQIKGNIINNIEIIKRLGQIFAIMLFGAKYFPVDAEYVLSAKNNMLCVTVLDFGMFSPIDFKIIDDKDNELLSDENKTKKIDVQMEIYTKYIKDNIMELELYFPYDDNDYYPYFIDEFNNAADYYINNELNETISKNMLKLKQLVSS